MVQLLWDTVWWFLKELNVELPYDPGKVKTCLHRKLRVNVYSSIIYNSQKIEIIQMSIGGWMDKLNFPFIKKSFVTTSLLSWNEIDR